MKSKGLLFGLLGLAVIVTGVIVYKAVSGPKTTAPAVDPEESMMLDEILPTVDASVSVDLVQSAKANTVVITVKGLASKMTSVGYELSYDSQGLIKGVNSGSKPIDTTGKDSFEREIYLGTCSKNDCKPDVGVTKISLVLEFTDTEGKKSQFSKEYDL